MGSPISRSNSLGLRSASFHCGSPVPAGLDLQRQLDHCNDALNINFVGFSATFDVLYAYVENRLDTPVRPRTVQVNGMDVTASARFLGGEMAPGSKAAVVVRLGQTLFARRDRVSENCRRTIASRSGPRSRAFSEFPISWIDGSMPEGLGVRNEEVHLRPGACFPARRWPRSRTSCVVSAHAHGHPTGGGRSVHRALPVVDANRSACARALILCVAGGRRRGTTSCSPSWVTQSG